MESERVGVGISRRRFLGSALAAGSAAAGAGVLGACARASPGLREVVLYSSVDAPILGPIIAEFESQSGIRVRVVGDTEATKSTGLIERLLLERSAPRADVWWSSEQLGVMELASAGALESMTPAPGPVEEFPGGWPRHLRDAGGLWYGFACRARVIVYSIKRIAPEQVPTRLSELTRATLKGRVGMAAPGFGTTRVHLAALIAERGEEATRAWLQEMKDNGVKVYSGNSSVVRAVSHGEIDVGLTDTDDVHAGVANGWGVAMAFEAAGSSSGAGREFSGGGALVIPNTVARVRGGPHRREAASLVDFILSERVERMLALSDSRNAPLRESLARERPDLAIVNPWYVDASRLADALAAVSTMVRDVLGPR